jgi:hypothetical protein
MYNDDERYWQVTVVWINERARKIYRTRQEIGSQAGFHATFQYSSSTYLDEEALKCYTVEQGVSLFKDYAKRIRLNRLGSLPLE